MKKYHLVSMLLCLAILLSACSPVKAYQVEDYTYRDMRTLEDRMSAFESRIDAAHHMAESARKLGYAENSVIIQLAKQDYMNNQSQWEELRAIYLDLEAHWHEKELEYPTATYVWRILQDAGYNDTVIAGILGNMMAEVGGQTLSLDSTLNGTYYGLCQWSKGYSKVWWKDTEYQVEFLLDTIRYELDTYGYLYKKNYDFEAFLLEKNPRNAALAFAKAYERCGSGSYKQRQANATIAYNYFIS